MILFLFKVSLGVYLIWCVANWQVTVQGRCASLEEALRLLQGDNVQLAEQLEAKVSENEGTKGRFLELQQLLAESRRTAAAAKATDARSAAASRQLVSSFCFTRGFL